MWLGVVVLPAFALTFADAGFPIRDANTATTCVIDSVQLVTFLAQAGIAIDEATRGCQGWPSKTTLPDKYQKEECAADVSNIVKSFSWTASFLSSAINNCGIIAGSDPNRQAKCGRDVAGIVAAVGNLAQGGAGIAAACDPKGEGPRAAEDKENNGILVDYETAMALSRPPQEQIPPSGYLPPTKMARGQRDFTATTAMCVVYSLQSAWFLARAAVSIDSAASDCGALTAGHHVAAQCAASVSGVLAAFSAATSYIAGAAATCSHGVGSTYGSSSGQGIFFAGVKTRGAGCAAYIAMVTEGMAAIASNAAAASLDCAGTSPPFPPLRRLSKTEIPQADLDEIRRWLEMMKTKNISYPAVSNLTRFPEVLV